MNVYDAIPWDSDGVAVIEQGAEHSYADLKGDVDAISADMSEGEVVLLIAGNDYRSVCTLLAAQKARANLILLDARASQESVDRVVRDFEPEHVCRSGDPVVHHISGGAEVRGPECGSLILPTSGTMSRSKFVSIPYSALLSHCRTVTEVLGMTCDDVGITTLPVSYTYGLSVLNTHLISGGTVVLTDQSVMSPCFWQQYGRHGVTNINGTPFLYKMLDRLGLDRLDGGRLRFITQAGGRIDPYLQGRLFDYADSRGILAFMMYGQTEAGPRITMTDGISREIGSVGRPIPCIETRIVDELGNPVDEGETGEIQFRGPSSFSGYVECRGDLGSTRTQEWIATGDIGYTDHGNLHITGRRDRMVKVCGYRLNLDDLEQAINADHVRARVMFDGANVVVESTEDVREEVRGMTDIPDSVFRFAMVDAVPMSLNGKIVHR